MSKFCHSNLRHIRGEIREVVLEFQGLNRYEYFTQPSRPQELLWADEGILFVIPYTHPWSWMNEASVAYVNWLLDELFRLLALDSATPIVSTGFSMGGQEAIIYPMYADRPVAAVMANSPVCDLKYHLTEPLRGVRQGRREPLTDTLHRSAEGHPVSHHLRRHG